MGVVFNIEHANFISYITGQKGLAPFSEVATLRGFLESLAYPSEDRLVSGNEQWREQVSNTARGLLKRAPEGPEILSANDVQRSLEGLPDLFQRFNLYGLVVTPSSRDGDKKKEEIVAFDWFMKAAYSSGNNGLFLIPHAIPSKPEYELASGFVTIIDPSYLMRRMAGVPKPAVAFWTKHGPSCVLSITEGMSFYFKSLLPVINDRTKLAQLIRVKIDSEKAPEKKRVLHLSDLHFGRKEASARRSYLKEHLSRLAPINRVVITGDLFDDPERALLDEFEEFATDVERIFGHEAIVVPGNHDCRRSGNALAGLGRNFQFVADLGWLPVVIDDSLGVVFFCFNSAEIGDFARGSVPEHQRLSRRTKFDRLLKQQPRIESYRRIALVHHHPYAITTAQSSYERLAAFVFGRDDPFLAFDQAEEFLGWCAAMDVSLILHGHKHTPHNRIGVVPRGNRVHEIQVVGCGSTMGIGGKPMSYDVIVLEPDANRWSVEFYHDVRGDGSGFGPQAVTLDMRG